MTNKKMNKQNNILFSTFDYIIIATSGFLLLFSWLYVIIEYPNLPERIAVHFDAAGNPNGHNKKHAIWLSPIIFTALTVGLIFGAKNPKLLDFSNKIKNLQDEISQSKILLFSSLLLSSILCIIVFSMIKTSTNKTINMSWILPSLLTFIGIYLSVIFYYYLKTLKK